MARSRSPHDVPRPMERAILILLHVLGATVWVGGHIVLATSVLPRALRARDTAAIQAYEAAFERVGIPALVVQVLSGLRLAWIYAPPSHWLGFSDHLSKHVTLKLLALAGTVALALHARLSLVPKLARGPQVLPQLAAHIVLITLVAIFFVFVGESLRLGVFL